MKNHPLKVYLLFIALGAIVLTPIAYYVYDHIISNKLHKDGIKITAIVEHTSRSRNAKTRTFNYQISLAYQDQNGNAHYTDVTVNQEEYKTYYIGQKIEILMDKADPKLITLLDYEKYLQTEERVLAPNDLISFLEHNNTEAIQQQLNKISAKWHMASSGVYANDIRRSFLSIGGDTIIYATQLKYEAELKATFKKLKETVKGKFYPEPLKNVPFKVTPKPDQPKIPFDYKSYLKGSYQFKVHKQVDSSRKVWVVVVCKKSKAG